MNMYFEESDYNLDNYEAQFVEKKERLEALFSPFIKECDLQVEIFKSKIKNYRMRAEFRIWHEGDDFDFVMFDKEKNEIIKINNFPVASLIINSAMKELKILIKKNGELLKRKLFQIDFLSTSTHEILISLIYHKKLDDEWIDCAKSLSVELEGILQERFHTSAKVKIIGRARKQKIVLTDDYVVEEFTKDGKVLRYKQVENSFTQPNYSVAEQMLSWADKKTKGEKFKDLLEMYCGNGNFSLYLASNFNRVLATEISSSSVDAAQFNIAVNDISNVSILRLSAEEFTEAIKGTREFKRLRGIDLKTYQCETILVDPPRSGLDDQSLSMVSGYKKIVYISCNPDTLVENLEVLTKTHQVTSLALFDQFPFTHHMEVGVTLEQRVAPH